MTCFFIDAAPNVLQYIEAFERMLKPGGYWINLGPLLYHWQGASGDEVDDDRFHQSIELSYDEIKHVMGTYNFTILVRACLCGFYGLFARVTTDPCTHACVCGSLCRKSRSASACTRTTSSR